MLDGRLHSNKVAGSNFRHRATRYDRKVKPLFQDLANETVPTHAQAFSIFQLFPEQPSNILKVKLHFKLDNKEMPWDILNSLSEPKMNERIKTNMHWYCNNSKHRRQFRKFNLRYVQKPSSFHQKFVHQKSLTIFTAQAPIYAKPTRFYQKFKASFVGTSGFKNSDNSEQCQNDWIL